MPTWTAPRTWPASISAASHANVDIRDNQQALKDPPSANYELNQGSNYSYSSSTWALIDGTNLVLSLTTTGGDVMIHFTGSILWNGFAIPALLDVEVDGTRIVNDDLGGLLLLAQSATPLRYSFTYLHQGLSAGVHTFGLAWKSSSGAMTLYAGAGTANLDVHPQFWVRELT
jgi:hypothetical protein